METPVVPGLVDWSGENPVMYLKERPDGPFVTLVSFFRVVLSPHGRGHALVLLEAPLYEGSLPEALNVCVTDNEPLARWLVREYVAPVDAFRGAVALDVMEYRPLAGVAVSGDQRSAHVEWVKGPGIDVTLAWEALGPPFMVQLPVASAPRRSTMFAVLVEAGRVTATVNGRALRGQPATHDLAGRRSSTALVALSETWVRPEAA